MRLIQMLFFDISSFGLGEIGRWPKIFYKTHFVELGIRCEMAGKSKICGLTSTALLTISS